MSSSRSNSAIVMVLLVFVILGTFSSLPSCLALGHEPPPVLFQRDLERAARPRQQRLHRLVRYTHRLAYLDLAHALVVKEGQRQPLPLGQRLQRGVDALTQLALGQVPQLRRRL